MPRVSLCFNARGLSAVLCCPMLYLLQSVWNKGETMYSGIDKNPEKIKALLKKFGFRLYEVLDGKQISARFHPHVTKWNHMSPHVSPYFGYIAAEKVYAPFKRSETIRQD